MPRRRDLVVIASGAALAAGLPRAAVLAQGGSEPEAAGVVARRTGGTAVAVRAAGEAWLEPGSPVYRGDGIRTGPGATVRIDFAAGLVLVVGPRTEVNVDDYLRGGGSGAVGGSGGMALVLNLLVGIVRLIGPAEAGTPPPRRLEVRTRTAVASVRSTEWLVDATPSGTGVFVREGRVEVRGLAGGPAVLLEPGFGTDVPPGGAPTPPRRWGEARRDEALARTAP